jgi:hypothetical protein
MLKDDAGVVRVARTGKDVRPRPKDLVIGRQHDVAGLRLIGARRKSFLVIETIRRLVQV